MKNFKDEFADFMSKHEKTSGKEPHLIIGLFADSTGNLEAVVQKVHGSFITVRGMLSILLEQHDLLFEEVNKKGNPQNKPASIRATPDNKEALMEILQGMAKINPDSIPDKMKFVYDLKVKKDELESIKDKIESLSISSEERKQLTERAEQLLKEIAEIFTKAISASEEEDVDDILKNTGDLNKQSDIEEMMRKFGESIQDSDPDADVTDEDILS